jgi:hypothetical protein
MPLFAMKFPNSEIHALSNRYDYATDPAIFETSPAIRRIGYLTKPQMAAVAKWKSPRAAPKIERNSESLIIEATRIALSSPDEELRIKILTLIHGVGVPMASVVLHWFHTDHYPIIDYRALWSLGINEKPAVYTFDFWWSYVTICRQLSSEANVDMRTLDKALWQFSKENQQPRPGNGSDMQDT